MKSNEIHKIYIITNESMPGYVKIGYTKRDVQERVKELDVTGVPLPFEIYYACEVESKDDEKWLHDIFSDKKVRDGREFFKIDPERIVRAVKRIEIKEIELNNDTDNISEEQLEEIQERKKIRSRFDFKTYGINVGEEIYFSRDNNIKAIVLENNKIMFNGNVRGLSESAQELLGYKRQPAGTLYWMYDSETLDERRRRIDSENIKY